MSYIKKNGVAIIVGVGILACVISIGFYAYFFAANGFSKNDAHWGIFGNYVEGFLGTILALVSVGLIYTTYRHQVTSFTNQMTAARIQQFETTFFNLLETYRLSVERLHRRNDDSDLIKDYNRFYKLKCGETGNEYSEIKSLAGKDFFDMLYFILDGYYQENKTGVICYARINPFFKNQYCSVMVCEERTV